MKKRWKMKIIALILLLACLGSAIGSVASAAPETLVVKVDDEPLFLHSPVYASDAGALLPLRELAQHFGYTVTWTETAQSAVMLSEEKELAVVTVGTADYTFQGVSYTASQPAKLIQDRLYAAPEIIGQLSGLESELQAEAGILSFRQSGTQDTGVLHLRPTQDTYVQGGNTADTNYGSSNQLDFKAGTGATNRLIYLKYSLKEIDFTFEEARIALQPISAEDRYKPVTVFVYASDPDSWQENTLTFNNQPTYGDLIQTTDLTFSTSPVYIDVTAYAQRLYAEGKTEMALVLDGDYGAPLRMTFNNSPILDIFKNASSKIVKDLPVKEGFGQGQDPWVWAEQMWESSQFKKTADQPQSSVTLQASATAYATGGRHRATNFGNQETIQTKSDPDSSDTARRAYVQFDLTVLPKENFRYAYLNLFCTSLQDSTLPLEQIYLVPSTWNEDTLTWENKPENGDLVAQAYIVGTNTYTSFDISDAIQDALARGQEMISFAVVDTAKRHTVFASRHAKNSGPYLSLSYGDHQGFWPDIPSDRLEEYNLRVQAKRSNDSSYVSYPTRVLESLPDYVISGNDANLSQFDGSLDLPIQEATGYYHTQQVGSRWWIIDPEGHPMLNAAVVTVRQPGTDAEWAGLQQRFGTLEQWGRETTDILRNQLHFNGVGAWSTTEYLDMADQPLSSANLLYFLATYMGELGLQVTGGGSTVFSGGAFNVFDPDFVTFCDSYAQENVAPKRDSQTVLGWMSDNELPGSLSMLDDMLALDPSDPLNAYSYAAAWTFVKRYTGKENPTFADISLNMREDFRDYVYDRYFQVVSSAIRKYDPNHMYLGCRFYTPTIDSRGCWSAAGRYCDAISVNYYYTWTPNTQQMRNWYLWSGKPFIATEWYAMGYDSGLVCSSGAGFRVDTQRERGVFYQNFILKLLEAQNCVGFHWFQYQDNDPTATNRDSSNIDGNKGIVNTAFQLYTPLVTEMAELNRNLYRLVQYFDSRK